MIINTGGRTDTVNYYSDWLLNRFEEGFVYSRNPLFPNHITKYTLDPSVVDCVVFCSKNYRSIMSKLYRITDRFNVFSTIPSRHTAKMWNRTYRTSTKVSAHLSNSRQKSGADALHGVMILYC